MREFVRPIAAALGVVCLAAAIATASAGEALAQAKEAPPQQTSPAAQATKNCAGGCAGHQAERARGEPQKKMPPKEKKDALPHLNPAVKAPPPPIENKGNIDLVSKYYDKLADALGDDQE